MATQQKILGFTATVPRGDWNASTSYNQLNLVRHKTASFYSKVNNNQGIEPFVTQGWEDAWQVCALDGDKQLGVDATVLVNQTTGEASAVVTRSFDSDGNPVFNFVFSGIKGEKGDSGTSVIPQDGRYYDPSLTYPPDIPTTGLLPLPNIGTVAIGKAYVVEDNEYKGQVDLYFKGEGGSTWTVIDNWGGIPGQAATIEIGTVTTLPAGSQATVQNVGTQYAARLNFGIPQGEQGIDGPAGPAGPANSLRIGSVLSGTSAGATITGDAPDQTLNLVLPKGDKGDAGNPVLYYTGSLSTTINGTTTILLSNLLPYSTDINTGALIVSLNGYMGRLTARSGSNGSAQTLYKLLGDQGSQGEPGPSGIGIIPTTTSTSTTTTSISISTLTIPEWHTLQVGDIILGNSTYSYLYRVTAVNATTVTVSYLWSIRGAQGASGTQVVSTLNGTTTAGRAIYAPTNAGTSGYILVSNGTGAAPTFQSLPIQTKITDLGISVSATMSAFSSVSLGTNASNRLICLVAKKTSDANQYANCAIMKVGEISTSSSSTTKIEVIPATPDTSYLTRMEIYLSGTTLYYKVISLTRMSLQGIYLI